MRSLGGSMCVCVCVYDAFFCLVACGELSMAPGLPILPPRTVTNRWVDEHCTTIDKYDARICTMKRNLRGKTYAIKADLTEQRKNAHISKDGFIRRWRVQPYLVWTTPSFPSPPGSAPMLHGGLSPTQYCRAGWAGHYFVS